MIRAAVLALLLSGCARTSGEHRTLECQRQAAPWLQADCQSVSKEPRA